MIQPINIEGVVDARLSTEYVSPIQDNLPLIDLVSGKPLGDIIPTVPGGLFRRDITQYKGLFESIDTSGQLLANFSYLENGFGVKEFQDGNSPNGNVQEVSVVDIGDIKYKRYLTNNGYGITLVPEDPNLESITFNLVGPVRNRPILSIVRDTDLGDGFSIRQVMNINPNTKEPEKYESRFFIPNSHLQFHDDLLVEFSATEVVITESASNEVTLSVQAISPGKKPFVLSRYSGTLTGINGTNKIKLSASPIPVNEAVSDRKPPIEDYRLSDRLGFLLMGRVFADKKIVDVTEGIEVGIPGREGKNFSVIPAEINFEVMDLLSILKSKIQESIPNMRGIMTIEVPSKDPEKPSFYIKFVERTERLNNIDNKSVTLSYFQISLPSKQGEDVIPVANFSNTFELAGTSLGIERLQKLVNDLKVFLESPQSFSVTYYFTDEDLLAMGESNRESQKRFFTQKITTDQRIDAKKSKSN